MTHGQSLSLPISFFSCARITTLSPFFSSSPHTYLLLLSFVSFSFFSLFLLSVHVRHPAHFPSSFLFFPSLSPFISRTPIQNHPWERFPWWCVCVVRPWGKTNENQQGKKFSSSSFLVWFRNGFLIGSFVGLAGCVCVCVLLWIWPNGSFFGVWFINWNPRVFFWVISVVIF